MLLTLRVFAPLRETLGQWLDRNRLLARDVVDSAERLGLRVLTVDGSLAVAAVTNLVEEHALPFLPRWRY